MNEDIFWEFFGGYKMLWKWVKKRKCEAMFE